MDKSVVVAIPVKDEADRIGPCLDALNRQTERPDAVVLLLNNCIDRTESIARAMIPDLGFRLEIMSREFPPAEANAGYARRIAMAASADLAGYNGILLSSDADSIVAPDWIGRNLAALRHGADVVCGRAIIDPVEAALIPAHLHEDDFRECSFIGLLDELAWTLDPEFHDPPPRHIEASGASLGVSVEAFRRVGGIPAIASGEDRAFVRSMWLVDGRIRHDPNIKVVVSGRIEGRAPGGMADAIRRRMVTQDEFTDDQAEPARDALRRYSLRQRVRLAWKGSADFRLAADLGIAAKSLLETLEFRFFGEAWGRLESISPVLQRRRVRFVDVAGELKVAQALLDRLALPDTLAAD